MKPTVKIPLILGAAAVAVGIVLWLRSNPASSRLDRGESDATLAHRMGEGLGVRASGEMSNSHPSHPVSGGARVHASRPTPESVQAILSAATTASHPDRVKAVRALPLTLTPQEIQAFHAYLLSPAASDPANRQDENWLRNELMNKLAGTPTLPADFARVLIAIYQDPAQDIVMRDYAVQHITPIYSRASTPDQEALRQTLWQAVEETDGSIAGTALLALRELAEEHREFDTNQLGEAAFKLAGDDRCGELSRITALQLCGRIGIQQAAPLALELARQPGSVPLQIAAIAALGDVGDAAARDYLRQLALQPEPRLRPALDTALKKLNQRLGT